MRKLLATSALAILGLVGASAIAVAQKPGAHVGEEPVCTLNDGSVTCTGGFAAGLGNQPVTVTASADAFCETRPGNNRPAGHAQFTSAPIQPRGGRINFPTFTLTANCPPGLNPVVGSVVTYTLLNASGNVILTFTVTAT